MVPEAKQRQVGQNKDKLGKTNWAKLYIGLIERFTKLQERNSVGILPANELDELNSLNSELENLEKAHGITVRWQVTDFVYKKFHDLLLMEKLGPVVAGMHKAAVERKQYIELLSKFVPGMQAFNKLNRLAEKKMNELKKQVQKYNCSVKPTHLSLPGALKSSELCKLDSAEWVSLQQLKEECDLDPLDNVKIAAIKQKGLLDSAIFEKKQLKKHMNNVLEYYYERSESLKKLICDIIDVYKNVEMAALPDLWKIPLVYHHQIHFQEKYEDMKKQFETISNASEMHGTEFDYADIAEEILWYDSD